MNEYSKRGTDGRRKNFCIVGMKRQIRNWEKKYEYQYLLKREQSSDNGKFNGKTRENNQKHNVTNVRVIVMLAETVKQKV